jgi:hypothetical protein
MRTRRWLGRTALLTVLALAGCGKPQANRFVWSEAKCEVTLPGVVKDVAPTESNLPNLKIKGADQKGGAYLISYADLPPKEEKPADVVYEECIQGALAGQRDSKKVGDERPPKLDGQYPGREWVMEYKGPDGQRYWARVRLYLVGNRLYLLTANGTEAFVRSKDTDDYLNSLVLIK